MSAQPQLPGVERPPTTMDVIRAREREQPSETDRPRNINDIARARSRGTLSAREQKALADAGAVAEAIEVIASMTGCPRALLPLFLAWFRMVTLLGGRTRAVEIYGADLGEYLPGTEPNPTDETKAKRAARYNARLREWQEGKRNKATGKLVTEGSGWQFGSWLAGGGEDRDGQHAPHTYDFPLVEVVAQLIARAPDNTMHRARRMREIAEPLLDALRSDEPTIRLRDGLYYPRCGTPPKAHALALAWFRKALDDAPDPSAEYAALLADLAPELSKRGVVPVENLSTLRKEEEEGGQLSKNLESLTSGQPVPPEFNDGGYLDAARLARLADPAELPDERRTQGLCGAADLDGAELPDARAVVEGIDDPGEVSPPAELPELPPVVEGPTSTDRPRPVVALVTSGIPLELRALRQWVGWRYVPDPSRAKPAKCPIDPSTGARARVNDRSSWGTFERALAAVERFDLDGVGFVLVEGGGVAVLDLDGCADPSTGELSPDAWRAVDRLDSYTEVSPSGTGVHVWVRGELPPGRRRSGGVEMYDGARYICVTGARVAGTPSGVEERGAELRELHGLVFPSTGPGAIGATSTPDHTQTVYAPPAHAEDADVIEMLTCARSRHAGLWWGETPAGKTPSEGDLSLCGRLVFYVGPDAARVDALFRRSDRLADKARRADWDTVHYKTGETYGQHTIDQAIIGHRGPYYTGRRP